MDVESTLGGQRFVWDSDKAALNPLRHGGITFEQGREAFLDPQAEYVDATPEEEERSSCIGLAFDLRLLVVVHVLREHDIIRIISARKAEPWERDRHENE